MIYRDVKLSKSQSFFLFGARGTGKTTLLKERFLDSNAIYIDLLSSSEYQRFLRNPDELASIVKGTERKIDWIIIDEIQKVPPLLDVVHQQIESSKLKFILTGSSSRKLKRGGGNLLGGRAFVFELFPLTHLELKEKFDLDQALQWGSLPKVFDPNFLPEDKELYLQAYTQTYLKEEIQEEQLVRNLKSFLLFLDVAAQMNGKILNYSKIGKDVGIDTKTVQNYFDILEETHIGYRLTPFHESLRKRQKTNPKFYFFDIGVQRSLQRVAFYPVVPSSYEYGNVFEHFVILEFFRLNSYFNRKFRFSFLSTHHNFEVDLVIDRPRAKTVFCEIKSTDKLASTDLRSLVRLKTDFPDYEYYCLSRDPYAKDIDGVRCLPWREGISELFAEQDHG